MKADLREFRCERARILICNVVDGERRSHCCSIAPRRRSKGDDAREGFYFSRGASDVEVYSTPRVRPSLHYKNKARVEAPPASPQTRTIFINVLARVIASFNMNPAAFQ
jgi:hypothetical protein